MGHPNRCRACRDEGVTSRQELLARLLDDEAVQELQELHEPSSPYRFTREYELEQQNHFNLESVADKDYS